MIALSVDGLSLLVSGFFLMVKVYALSWCLGWLAEESSPVMNRVGPTVPILLTLGYAKYAILLAKSGRPNFTAAMATA